MPFSLAPVTLGTDRRGKPVTSCVVHNEDEEKASKPKKAGRKAKCTANEMLQYFPAASVVEWQERLHEETGLGETQFYGHKKTLETAGRIRREPGTSEIIQADSIDAMPDLSEEF